MKQNLIEFTNIKYNTGMSDKKKSELWLQVTEKTYAY